MIYRYDANIKIGHKEILFTAAVKETKFSAMLEKFSYILEWFSVGFLFYLNTTYIHSKLFAIFVFILGFALLQTLKFERKLSTKEEFLKKVNEMLGDEQ